MWFRLNLLEEYATIGKLLVSFNFEYHCLRPRFSLCDVFLLRDGNVTNEVFMVYSCEPGFQGSLNIPSVLSHGAYDAFYFTYGGNLS